LTVVEKVQQVKKVLASKKKLLSNFDTRLNKVPGLVCGSSAGHSSGVPINGTILTSVAQTSRSFETMIDTLHSLSLMKNEIDMMVYHAILDMDEVIAAMSQSQSQSSSSAPLISPYMMGGRTASHSMQSTTQAPMQGLPQQGMGMSTTGGLGSSSLPTNNKTHY
jgi:hypothetical protein